jgi:transglutaminase-like putative cysteine protease
MPKPARHFAVVFALLASTFVFASFAFAQELNPKELGAAKLSVTQTWTLEFGEGAAMPREVFLETYAFPTTPYQRVSYSASPEASESKDKFGNSRLRFYVKPGYQQMKAIELDAVAEINYSAQNEGEAFAAFEPLGEGDEARYSNGTALTEPKAEIKALAESLAQGAADDFEVVARLAEWVGNNVVYDASYWKRTVDAATVLSEKRGVCNQFATLLIAMLRSRGIPARFTAGFVYSGENWGPHAWVEAAVAGKDGARYWLPVDPTFGEVGLLNAGHLKFAHGLDQNDIAEAATAGVILTKSEPRVSVEEKTNFGELFEIALNAPSMVGPNSAEEFAAAIKSKASQPLALPFAIIAPSQPPSLAVRVADGELRLVYLQPGEEKAVSWTLVFPSDLKPNFVYNFSVSVQGFGKKVSTTVQGKTDVEPRKLEKLSIKRFTARDEGAREAFSIVVVNEGNTAFDAVDVSGEFNGVKQRESFSLAPSEEKLVAFSFVKPSEPGVYSGSFKARAPVGGASAEQPFQLEIAAPQGGGGALPSISVSAESIPQDYYVYAAAAAVFAVVLFVAVSRARKARHQSKQ